MLERCPVVSVADAVDSLHRWKFRGNIHRGMRNHILKCWPSFLQPNRPKMAKRRSRIHTITRQSTNNLQIDLNESIF